MLTKKKRHISARCKQTISAIIVLTAVILMLLLAFVHYEQENETNTYTETGLIRDVERAGSTHRKWVRFCMNGKDYYYTVFGSGKNMNAILSEFQQAEQQKQVVTLSVTDELEFHHLLHTINRGKVVAAYSENGLCISIDAHNQDQRFRQILWLVLAAMTLVIFVAWKVLLWRLDQSAQPKRPQKRRINQRVRNKNSVGTQEKAPQEATPKAEK